MTRLLEVGAVDIEAIKDEFPLQDFVGETVTLKKKGREWVGLCPFHDERTPSFKIYTSDQRYHCFGCGAHGDLFDFAKHIKGWSIRETAEQLGMGVVPTYSADRVEEIRQRRIRLEEAEQAERAKVIEQSQARWNAAASVLSHDYLTAKAIKAHGTRVEADGRLLTPLIGPNGKIQCVQAISPDGRKEFPYKGTVSGGFYILGGKVSDATDTVILCEGFATAATLQEATGRTVICAYNGHNMVKVAAFFAGRYPSKSFIVAADDDHSKDDNPGLKHADQAAAALGCMSIAPARPEGGLGTDFNDMAAVYGLEAVRALVVAGQLPAEAAEPPAPDIFPLLTLDELEALPPPTWLVDELVPENGFTIVYGDPGAGKSFVVLDMALRAAYGMDWHGRTMRQCGVLYIAGEGRYGLGKRVKGWRKEHRKQGLPAPFLLQPVAVQMLDKDSRAKLIRTINEIVRRCGFAVGLVVIDTVSRSIAGQDENKQESMSLFVDGCSEVQDHTHGAVIGVHHSGKEKDRGMRGSTVLLGACDSAIRLSKDNGTVKLMVEKQKDAEESEPIHFTMKVVEWVSGFGPEESTLVPVIADQAPQNLREFATLSRRQADEIFQEIDRAWNARNPWSAFPNAKRSGRYVVSMIAERYDVPEHVAEDHVRQWQQNEYMVSERVGRSGTGTGLRVVKMLEK